jgi:NAD-dependent deacetylase
MEDQAVPIEQAREILEASSNILVFSGAGISTESGIPDFRGPEGLWTKVDPDDFHIDRYLSRPSLRVNAWQMHARGERWGARGKLLPNRGHDAVVDLWRAGRLAGVVTQNVDGLHQAAGLPDEMVTEVHGNVHNSHCLRCGAEWPTEVVLERVNAGEEDPHCGECGGVIKTRVVMFGEELDFETMARAFVMLSEADALLVLGSTVAVFPASDVVMRAALKPIPIVIVNMGPTEADHLAQVRLEGPIGELLPTLVASL